MDNSRIRVVQVRSNYWQVFLKGSVVFTTDTSKKAYRCQEALLAAYEAGRRDRRNEVLNALDLPDPEDIVSRLTADYDN